MRCGGGTTLAALDAATQAYGLAVPSGTVSHTGVGGLTLGGGIGWLTEEYGLSCDNLLAAETVLADGRVLRAAADQHPELFWALRGGGGNFGVVTEFTFRLHPVGPEVQLGLFFWDLADGDAVLRRLRETVPELPPGTGVFTGIGLAAPPMALVPPEHRGRPGHTLLVAGFDGPEAHARALAPLAEGPPALVERRAPIPYRYLQRLLDDHAPYGILAHDRALPLPVLDDAVLELLGAQLPGRSSPLTFCPSFRLDGAYTAVPEEDTAFGGARRPCWVMNISALALEPRRLRADAAWAAALWTELLPYAANPGGYVNFLAQGEQDRVRASYGPKYARLAAAKARYDPGNVFHRNANILPEPGRGAGGAPSPPG
nr:FAD-binding protein [Streptomyces sp. SCSIO ZS0520]